MYQRRLIGLLDLQVSFNISLAHYTDILKKAIWKIRKVYIYIVAQDYNSTNKVIMRIRKEKLLSLGENTLLILHSTRYNTIRSYVMTSKESSRVTRFVFLLLYYCNIWEKQYNTCTANPNFGRNTLVITNDWSIFLLFYHR